MYILESVLLESERHTGARILCRSGTVDHAEIVAAYICDVLRRFVRRDPNGARCFDIRSIPRVIRTTVDDGNLGPVR